MIKSLIVVYLVLSAVIGIATQIVLAYLYVAIWGFDRMNAAATEMQRDGPECEECEDMAEHSVPNAPGMGNRYYCEECCPRCNFGSGTGGNEER